MNFQKKKELAAERTRYSYLSLGVRIGATVTFWVLVYGGTYFVCNPAINIDAISCVQVSKIGLASEIGRLLWGIGGTVTINSIVSWIKGGRAVEVTVKDAD